MCIYECEITTYLYITIWNGNNGRIAVLLSAHTKGMEVIKIL